MMQKVKLTFRHHSTDDVYLEVDISANFPVPVELQEVIGVEVVRFAQQEGLAIYGVSQLIEF